MMDKHKIRRRIVKLLKLALLLAVAAFSLYILSYGVVFLGHDRSDMHANYWRADNLYYESIGMYYFDLACIILGASISAASLWKAASILFPHWKPSWLRPIPRERYRIMALVFGALFLLFACLTAREIHLISVRDFSHDEAPWAAGLYFAEGRYSIAALLCAEGIVFSVRGLWKKRKEQTGESMKLPEKGTDCEENRGES